MEDEGDGVTRTMTFFTTIGSPPSDEDSVNMVLTADVEEGDDRGTAYFGMWNNIISVDVDRNRGLDAPPPDEVPVFLTWNRDSTQYVSLVLEAAAQALKEFAEQELDEGEDAYS